MTVVVCDLCGARLEPRPKDNYGWLSAGGVVALVGRPGDATPARFHCGGRDLREICISCCGRPDVFVRAWVRPRG